jgi:hypothetical protein
MTMLDDDTLAVLFTTAGEAFAVPETGASDIVARAFGTTASESPDEEDAEADADSTGGPDELDRGHRAGTLRRVTASARRHRILSVAACIIVLLVLVGSVGALTRSSPKPAATSSLAKPPPRSLVPRSTSVPGFRTNHTPSPNNEGVATGGAPASPLQGKATAGSTNTPALPNDAVGQSAKIEQTGSLGLRVGRGELSKTMTELANVATTFGGFVANSQTQSGAGTGGAPYGTITLQIPVQNFSPALRQAQSFGRTTSLSTKATDVTGQYVDLQSRIAALQASRQQYLTIMTKANTVGDVLAVQAQLDTIQSQIEQLQGQLQVLTSETSYSALTVTAGEGTPPPRPAPLPPSGLVRAWHDGIGGFVGGVEGLIRVAGPTLFALLCLAALVLGGRALWRSYQRRHI